MTQWKPEILQFFNYEHLPTHLADVSRPFCDLARRIPDACGPSAESAVALRKLLEAKDAAVRAALLQPKEDQP